MGRQVGLEGSIRELPPKSGQWRGRLPARIDQHRRYIDGVFLTKAECRRELNKAIADHDAGRTPTPSTPQAPGAPTRRVHNVVEEYIEARRTDTYDPIGINTVREYTELLKNVIGRPAADLSRAAVRQLDPPAIAAWYRQLRGEGVKDKRATKAMALVSTALSWEVAEGRLPRNPARDIARRRPTTKSGRSTQATADPVLLPSWKEAATLLSHPARLEDRLLLLVLAWAGLRWSEAVGLGVRDVWPDRPLLSVRRTFARKDGGWHVEAVKGGMAQVVPLPRPLWEALLRLAASRTIEDRHCGDLLFRPTRRFRDGRPTEVIEGGNFYKRVWLPARTAAGLNGDDTLSTLDPRHRAMKVKDLRAYAASVIVDAGGTPYEAAALLRHANVQTTNRFYARAQDERSQDPARTKLRISHDLTLPQRIDALWDAWIVAYPDLTANLLTEDARRRRRRTAP